MTNIPELLVLFFTSIVLSYTLIKVFSFVFRKYGILDKPHKYGYKRAPVPYSMGVIFFLNFLILSLFFVEHNMKYYVILALGFVITIISFFDDLFDISAKLRLFIQIMIGALIGITSIKIGYISNIFGGVINLETHHFELFGQMIYTIPLIFTIFWYVLIFNSLNWSDGIPGITSGLSSISFFILFVLAITLFFGDDYVKGVKNAMFVAEMSIILFTSTFVFWLFDFREKILMGDSGTMFLAFMLATLSIISGGKVATVLVVFGIYFIDAFYVIIKRVLAGKSPLNKDFTHFHHRLLDAGLPKKHILFIIYSLSFLFGIGALFMDKLGKIIIFFILVVIVIFMNDILSIKEKVKKIKKTDKLGE
ncbi:MAG: MraY family glycosyltransferase [Candidatus Gracilibacteria bacterium]|nr:MraY family glycosyltransferase [Candidatus Gracilibacteria bacterium]